MSRAVEESNRRLLRARDAMDRAYAEALDVPMLARIAHVCPAHFIRTFRATFGETPHRYLQRRRVERAMFLLRETEQSVTDICLAVGFTSLGTFSRTFRDVTGESPTGYRKRAVPPAAPGCFTMAYSRPASFSERPGPPSMDEKTAEQVRELIAKGASGFSIGFTTDDARKTYEDLKAKGVEMVDGPNEQSYGIDFGARDPFGNHFRVVQPPAA
ncbi:hypothetical protein GCM10027280_20100 [Micromonospora polyrhachis]|uniref:AraC-like DNA-binding protein n=1 Tax=Micromonospora polyrhachis TaxID=1282883 RepID=A0A7W7WSU3_9ACTN|nr:helix-turn-helix domain-containing protein [Micromonospora polyrhachis]MBB4961773.1 AraC-like DNA-binding protein [Micromonospora polyrhachis]